MPGTQYRSPLFSDKKRLKTCREARGFSQEELIRIVESLPDNHGKSRSVKHLSYLENETRPMSIEYATLLAQALTSALSTFYTKMIFQQTRTAYGLAQRRRASGMN